MPLLFPVTVHRRDGLACPLALPLLPPLPSRTLRHIHLLFLSSQLDLALEASSPTTTTTISALDYVAPMWDFLPILAYRLFPTA
ncbi:hypothetical protein ONZ45_g14686 [Pleurotus djamor]|nr:hypothetical protein ONZ45_g14686 [Pleurotus djamor]